MTIETGTFNARLAIRVLIAACLVLALGSCGRRGSPEPPPSASVISTDEQGNVIRQREETVDRPFILDPLLQ